jgi:molecular chaperone DnaK
MGAVVGIDLGTTNTVVACVRAGRVHVLADERGNRLLPSVVSFHPSGDVLVGHAAKARRLVDAKNTIASIKRLVGKPWDSDEIRLARSRFPFELREGPGQGALVVARGEAYTLPEISAFVLKRVRQIAEAALGETVDMAVITVPAHFNELQRASTKVAGRVAGLEVLRILNEPTAAALAYGFGSSKNERVAVYDYGGGTFDCSLLELSGNLYEVLATAGDTFLGGDDIDTAIAEQICSAFLLQHRVDPRVDRQAYERILAAAEQLKIELSSNQEAQVDLRDVAYGIGGAPLGLTFGMTQADLDTLSEPFIERTLQVTQDALNISRLSPTSFDRIVLVGGSTRMPLVKRRVEAFFAAPPMDRVNPDEVVAIGAAIQAAALAEGGKRSIPPPPLPRSVHPEADPANTTTDIHDVPSDLFQDGQPERKLPSVAPPRASSRPLPPPPPRQTLRPAAVPPLPPPVPPPMHAVHSVMEQVEQVIQENIVGTDQHPSLRSEDSMTRANTLPGRNNTLPSAQADRSVSRGHTLPSPQTARRADRSIAEPPSITGVPSTERVPHTLPIPTLRHDSVSRPPRPPPVEIPPLATEDISLFGNVPVPGARRGEDPSLVGSLSRGARVGPLPTEDISMIVPDAQASVSMSSPARHAGAAGMPGLQAGFLPVSGPAGAPSQPSSAREGGFVVPVGDPRAAPGWQPRIAPVLVDVTPRSLVVEVVGGFTDSVIARNATIPCEHTRVFATGRDLQTTVHLRVAQGEAEHFADNTYLGELELSGLRPAPRGDVTLSVTFEIDADGTLQVRAMDTSTHREARATMRLVAVAQTEEEIEQMIERSRSVSVTGG